MLPSSFPINSAFCILFAQIIHPKYLIFLCIISSLRDAVVLANSVSKFYFLGITVSFIFIKFLHAISVLLLILYLVFHLY